MFTALEKKVYNSILDLCWDEVEADVRDIANDTGLEINTIKGVVGSLSKKDMLSFNEEIRNGKKFLGIWPIVNNEPISYGWDLFTQEEYSKFKI